MITKRSNHIPTLTAAATPKMTQGLLRARRDQNTWGVATLQNTIVQYAQAYGPNARLMNTNPSAGFPLYHEMKNSIAYAYPTIMPVASRILHMFSRWSGVITSFSPNHWRHGTASASTISNPPKIAPATK